MDRSWRRQDAKSLRFGRWWADTWTGGIGVRASSAAYQLVIGVSPQLSLMSYADQTSVQSTDHGCSYALRWTYTWNVWGTDAINVWEPIRRSHSLRRSHPVRRSHTFSRINSRWSLVRWPLWRWRYAGRCTYTFWRADAVLCPYTSSDGEGW